MLKVFIIAYIILGMILANWWTTYYKEEGGKYADDMYRPLVQIILVLISVPLMTIVIIIARVKPELIGQALVWAKRYDEDEDDKE